MNPKTLQSPIKYDLDQVVEASGTSREHMEDLMRWLGRTTRDPKMPFYTDKDVEFIRYTADFAEAEGIDRDTLGSIIRNMALLLERLSMQQVESVIQTAMAEGATDTEARLIAAETAPERASKLMPILDLIWHRQYATSVHRLTTTAIAQRGLNSDDHDFPILRAVGFADLANFTARTKDVNAAEFTELIRDFTDACFDIVNIKGGRIINFIGDEVFFVADDIKIGAEIALALAEHSLHGVCGPVRVGLVWTRVLAAHGDVFGPGVNLAARITSIAEPGEVYIGPAAAARLMQTELYQIVPQQAFDARGLGIVQPYRLRHASDTRNFPAENYDDAL